MTTTPLDHAHTLAELGRWDAAASEAARALAAEPSSVDAMCLLARCHDRAGRHEEAVAVARRAVAASPGNDHPLCVLATSANSAGLNDEALRAASDAVRIDPHHWGNHLVLASILIDLDRHTEATGYAWQAVQLAPHEPGAHNMFGVALAGTGDAQGARTAYLEALRLDPHHSDARNNNAILDLEASRLGSAAQGIAAGLRDAPQESVLRHNLDVVGEALIGRLLNAMLLTGILVIVVLGLEQAGVVPAWWPRALAGLALLGVYAAVLWSTLRHLPPGMRRHLRSLPRRSTRRWPWIVVSVVSLALLLVAFAPGSIASLGAGIFIVIIRGFQIVMLIGVVRWIVRKVRRTT